MNGLRCVCGCSCGFGQCLITPVLAGCVGMGRAGLAALSLLHCQLALAQWVGLHTFPALLTYVLMYIYIVCGLVLSPLKALRLPWLHEPPSY